MTHRTPIGERPGVPLEEAWTIPSSWYFDPEHHRRELDRVFARSWQHVARTAQLDGVGAHVTAEIAGEPVFVVRGRDDALRAFFNVCRHRAGTVVRGEGRSKALACTYHGWTYGLDGSLLAAPEMDGVRDFDAKALGLVPIRCEAWGPYVFVNLDPAAPPLVESLGPLPRLAGPHGLESRPFGARDTYDIACNWKVYVDNYLEGYHIPSAHPGLNRTLDYRNYRVTAEGSVVTQEAPARTGGDATADYLYVWLFPNFMINVSPDYAQTNWIVPLGPERTLCIFDYYFDPAAGPEAEERRRKSIEGSDAIQKEDIAICESVQRNLRSRSYSAGRYSAKRENGVYHFHELLRGQVLT